MNKHRGEREFKAGDKTYTLRPTTDALQEIEEALNTGLVKLVLNIETQDYRIKDIAMAVHLLAKAGGSKESFADLREAVMEAGLLNAAAIVAAILTSELTASRQKKAQGPVEVPTASTG